jgi:hypothetical protein
MDDNLSTVEQVEDAVISSDTDWTEMSIRVTAPDGATKIRPVLYFESTGSDSAGTVTFDDYLFETAPFEGDVDIFWTEDFEGENADLPDGWKSVVGDGATAAYIDGGTAGDEVHSGDRAVSIYSPVADNDRWHLLTSDMIAVTSGVDYVFSVWAKTENMTNSQAYISMAWNNSLNQSVGSEVSDWISNDMDWSEMTVCGTAPEGATKVRLMLFASGSAAGSSALITYDDCSFGTVTEPVVGLDNVYDVWTAGYSLIGSPDADPDTDYDGDLLTNLEEYGLGGDPANPLDKGYMPVHMILEDSGTNWFYYVHPVNNDAAAEGLTYTLEERATLTAGSWTNADYEVMGVASNGYAQGFNAVTNRISTEDDEALFLHLNIEGL